MGLLQSVFQRQSAKLTFRHGVGYEQKQLNALAVRAFTKAIAQGFSPIEEGLVRRGINRIEIQDINGAIADFESVIQRDRTQEVAQYAVAQALFYRGKLYEQAGDRDAALNCWTAAGEHCSTYALPYYHKALHLIDKSENELAIEELSAAIAADPSMAIAYLQRGNLHNQMGNREAALIDWQYAISNDFTLARAKESLQTLQHHTYEEQLTRLLEQPLAEKNLTVEVRYKQTHLEQTHLEQTHRPQTTEDSLEISIHREAGIGINYYTLPDLIREYLVPLQLPQVSRFKLIGRVGEENRPDWTQTYELYKGQPCPPSHWQAAALAILLFPPLAVPALIQAASVKRIYKRGRYVEALNASHLVNVFSAASSIPFGFFVLLMVSYGDYGKTDPTHAQARDRTAQITNCQTETFGYDALIVESQRIAGRTVNPNACKGLSVRKRSDVDR